MRQALSLAVLGLAVGLILSPLVGGTMAPLLRLAALLLLLLAVAVVVRGLPRLKEAALRGVQGRMGQISSIYYQFAAQVGGEVQEAKQSFLGSEFQWPSEVTFPHGDTRARLTIVTPGSTPAATPHAHLSFQLARATPLRLSLAPRQGPRPAPPLSDVHNVSLGIPGFDSRFALSANDEALARRVFTPDVQQVVEALPWVREEDEAETPGICQIEVDDDRVAVRMPTLPTSLQELLTLKDAGTRVYEALAPLL
ncbi:MAG: hypothetical protein QHJ73_08710 [Armatimonadota bacterium]|nr:hypothetical protein [Armatimonadota bacterium]